MLLPLWSDWFSTLVFAGRLRFGDSFPLAFEHHFAFKLSDPSQHREHQLAGRRLGVHAKIENPHGDTLPLQRLKNCHQIRDRSGKPIQLGDDKNVAFRTNSSANWS